MGRSLGDIRVQLATRRARRPSSSGNGRIRSPSTPCARPSWPRARRTHRSTIEETGDISASDARDRVVDDDLQRAELLSIPVTLLVLLFAFGAVVAALVPVLLALTAVVAAFGLLGPISQAFPLDDATKTVVLLIGMAVGVDYALFYVIRSREERHRGLPSHEALERTARTSGRTVIVSGTTVAIAMAGMYVIGSKIFNGLASGTIAVVACAVVGSVTVLPAVLELLGPKIDRGRDPVPAAPAHASRRDSRFWPAVVDRVLRRPALSCALSAGLLVALALPALGCTSRSRATTRSRRRASRSSRPSRTSARPSPRTSEPAIVVVAAGRSSSASRRAARSSNGSRSSPSRAASRTRRSRSAAAPTGVGASLELPLIGAGDNAASRRAIEILRDDLVPATLGRVPGVETAVTGATAEDVDFTRQMKHGVPYVIVFVLALAFLLLLVAFRSIVVPLKAIVLNLLSVGAAYGVLVLVFQHHWAESLLGFKSNGAIISWLPLFLFVVLFGLSMDYHVFILSRVREAVDGGMATRDAVRLRHHRHRGRRHERGARDGRRLLAVRLALVARREAGGRRARGGGAARRDDRSAPCCCPSSMELLGEWNWYLPRFLERLPRASIEAPPARDSL